MPNIERAVAHRCIEVANRLQAKIVVTIGGAETEYGLDVSHQKHVIAAYRDNAGNPPTANVNTLINMSVNDFKSAFDNYVRLLAANLVGKNSDNFKPSIPANRIFVQQISFSSDSIRLGANIHCFPFNDGPGRTRLAISLAATAFNNFKAVAAYFYRRGGHLAGAQAAWRNIEALVVARQNDQNRLFTRDEIVAIRIALGGGAAAVARREQGQQRRILGVGARLDNEGRRPFRG